MSRLRTSMVLLGICVVAVLIAALRLATERTPLPAGSSYSTQPDGAMALFGWTEALGGSPLRLRDQDLDTAVGALLVLQPETLVAPESKSSFDTVADRGGTLVVAGDSLNWVIYVGRLGVSADPVAPATSRVSSPDCLTFALTTRFRLRGDRAQPLLVRDNGDWVGLRMPYRSGTLVIIASAAPFTNAGLADEQMARFVFRHVLSGPSGRRVAFDEIHHSFAPAAPGPATLNTLLFQTPAGRAVVYAALLTFAFVLLTGRRLGPALAERMASEAPRTMFEHVQMLANLYRRAHQLRVVRDALGHHYARALSRSGTGSTRTVTLAEAVARIQAAQSESELIAAVAAVDDPG